MIWGGVGVPKLSGAEGGHWMGGGAGGKGDKRKQESARSGRRGMSDPEGSWRWLAHTSVSTRTAGSRPERPLHGGRCARPWPTSNCRGFL